MSTRTRQDAPPRGGLRYIPTVALGTDLVLVTFSVFVAILFRQHVPATAADAAMSAQLSVAGPIIIIGWITAIFLLGGYRGQVYGAGLDEYKRVVNASLATSAVVGIACYLLQFQLSRGFFVLAFVVGIPVLVAGRFTLRRSVHRARRRGALQHRVLIAGAEGHIDEIAAVLRRESWLGYQVIGALSPNSGERSMTHSGVPLLGSPLSIAQVAIDAQADVVFLAGGAFDSSSDLRRLAWELEHEDVQLVIAPSVTDVSSERVRIRPVGGLPLVHLEKPRSEAAVRRAKRIFDLVLSSALIVAFGPVMLFAAFKVWRNDGGPVLFRQERIGRGGLAFTCLKFRTMVIDAEMRLFDVLREQGIEAGLFAKVTDDPRITAPGRWLRRFSIDELPQLFNVWRGDMSLVGPRPQVAHEVAQYDEDMSRRLRVRPGMTGLWQVSGRSDLSSSQAIRLDLYYVDNWSMAQDVTILARTFNAVLHPSGAY